MNLIIQQKFEMLYSHFKKHIPERKSRFGRPESCNNSAFMGIMHILITGSQWKYLPINYGSKSAVHRKFMKWIKMGVFTEFFESLKKQYLKKQEITNWSAIDTSHKKAPFGKFAGKNPTDRSKRGVKFVLVVDRKGVPLLLDVAASNTHDSKLFIPILEHIEPFERTMIIAADGAFDDQKLRDFAKTKNIILLASTNPRRNKNRHIERPRHRWIIERTFGIFSWFRGIRTCYNKSKESYLSFLQIVSAIRLLKEVTLLG